jgi:hypothetical protein
MENDKGILTPYPNADEMSRSSLADRLTIPGLSREQYHVPRVGGWSTLAVR